MAPAEWRFEAVVTAPPDDVYAWLSDPREDDHTSEAFRRGAGWTAKKGSASRRILSRDGDTIRIEDAWGRNRFRATVALNPEAREVRIHGEGGYEGAWRAEPADGGTRVVSEGRMDPTNPLFRLLLPLFRKKFLAQMEQDFKGHTEEIREELAGGA